ncbi:hypothetical protein J6590_103634 [Homalodisca vitripennis]|nr:hypothetical protein J6590_103634 [Homalodisca vitripennis]
MHHYNTQNAMNYALPIHRLTLYERKPSYAGPKLFNILPDHLKINSGQKCFKKKLQEWFLQRTFYSLEEFINWRNH